MTETTAHETPAIIFLHLPKTAGMTFRFVLYRQFPVNTIYDLRRGDRVSRIHEFINIAEDERKRLRCLTGHMNFGLHKYLPQGSRYVTFLRHPVDRIISSYYYILNQTNHRLHEEFISKGISLEEYVRMGEDTHLLTRRISGCDPIDRIRAPYDPLPAHALETAKHNLETHFSMVGLTERFDESLLLIKEALGWQNVYYVKRNTSNKRPPLSEIPKRTIELIEQSVAFDLELYAYVRQQLDERIQAHGEAFHRELRSFRRVNTLYALGRSGMMTTRHLFRRTLQRKRDQADETSNA